MKAFYTAANTLGRVTIVPINRYSYTGLNSAASALNLLTSQNKSITSVAVTVGINDLRRVIQAFVQPNHIKNNWSYTLSGNPALGYGPGTFRAATRYRQELVPVLHGAALKGLSIVPLFPDKEIRNRLWSAACFHNTIAYIYTFFSSLTNRDLYAPGIYTNKFPSMHTKAVKQLVKMHDTLELHHVKAVSLAACNLIIQELRGVKTNIPRVNFGLRKQEVESRHIFVITDGVVFESMSEKLQEMLKMDELNLIKIRKEYPELTYNGQIQKLNSIPVTTIEVVEEPIENNKSLLFKWYYSISLLITCLGAFLLLPEKVLSYLVLAPQVSLSDILAIDIDEKCYRSKYYRSSMIVEGRRLFLLRWFPRINIWDSARA